jgi:hypothetical protein
MVRKWNVRWVNLSKQRNQSFLDILEVINFKESDPVTELINGLFGQREKNFCKSIGLVQYFIPFPKKILCQRLIFFGFAIFSWQ